MLQAPQPSAIPRHVVVVNLDSGEVAAGRDAALSGQLPDGTAFADGLGGWLFKLRESLVAEQITTISLDDLESSANAGKGAPTDAPVCAGARKLLDSLGNFR